MKLLYSTPWPASGIWAKGAANIQAASLPHVCGNKRQGRQKEERVFVAERAGKAVGHGKLAFGHSLQLLARFEAGLRVALSVDNDFAGNAVRGRFGEEGIAFAGKRRGRIFVGQHPAGGRRLRDGERRDKERSQRAGNERSGPRHMYLFFGPARDIAF